MNKNTMLAVRQGAITDEEIPVFRYKIQYMKEVFMISATILFIFLQIGRLAEACARGKRMQHVITSNSGQHIIGDEPELITSNITMMLKSLSNT
ncbi:hypothetical protein [Paenibacillus sp. 22594]|uniref:hypothetical protein n=1 Tax=Paenibacillus sp. 22594 TaxID=3453947 RepID=UPI003F859C64